MGTNSIVPRSGIPVVTMPVVYTKIPLFPSSFYDLLIEITFQIFLYILTFGKLIFLTSCPLVIIYTLIFKESSFSSED